MFFLHQREKKKRFTKSYFVAVLVIIVVIVGNVVVVKPKPSNVIWVGGRGSIKLCWLIGDQIAPNWPSMMTYQN